MFGALPQLSPRVHVVSPIPLVPVYQNQAFVQGVLFFPCEGFPVFVLLICCLESSPFACCALCRKLMKHLSHQYFGHLWHSLSFIIVLFQNIQLLFHVMCCCFYLFLLSILTFFWEQIQTMDYVVVKYRRNFLGLFIRLQSLPGGKGRPFDRSWIRMSRWDC